MRRLDPTDAGELVAAAADFSDNVRLAGLIACRREPEMRTDVARTVEPVRPVDRRTIGQRPCGAVGPRTPTGDRTYAIEGQEAFDPISGGDAVSRPRRGEVISSRQAFSSRTMSRTCLVSRVRCSSIEASTARSGSSITMSSGSFPAISRTRGAKSLRLGVPSLMPSSRGPRSQCCAGDSVRSAGRPGASGQRRDWRLTSTTFQHPKRSSHPHLRGTTPISPSVGHDRGAWLARCAGVGGHPARMCTLPTSWSITETSARGSLALAVEQPSDCAACNSRIVLVLKMHHEIGQRGVRHLADQRQNLGTMRFDLVRALFTPCACGSMEPVWRHCCHHAIAVDGATLKRIVAARADISSLTGATTRRRRSAEGSKAMKAGLLHQPQA